MKKILKLALALVAVGAVGVVAVASTQPDTFHVERSVAVAAAPADAFPYVNDFTKWVTWNPWQNLDPNQVTETSDPPAGKGAWTSWKGNQDVGAGKMTIAESVPDQKVVHDMHFLEPMEDHATVTFTLSPDGEQTQVTWAMDGEMNLMGKVMCLFMGDMEAMIAPNFEQGLATLKPLVEADAANRIAAEKAAEEAAQAAAQAAAEAPEGAATTTAQ